MTLLLAALAVFFLRRSPGPPPPRWTRPVVVALTVVAAAAVGGIALALAVGEVRMRVGGVEVLRLTRLTWQVAVLPALVLGVIALEGRRRRTGPLVPREWMLTAGFLALLTYLLCLAPTLMIRGHPWGWSLFYWVYAHVPGGSAFRAPGRWSLVFALPLALLAALGAAALAERLRGRRSTVVLGLLFLALAVEYTTEPIPWRTLPPRPAVYDRLRDEPGDFAVLQIPIYEQASDAWAMLWAQEHRKWVVNGHGGFALPTWEALVKAAQDRDPDRLSAAIRSVYPLRYVVVHPWLLGRVWTPMAALMQEGRVPGLVRTGVYGTDELYRVEGTPQEGFEIARHFSSTWARRHPEAEYALDLADDPEVAARVEVRFNGRLVRTHEGPARARVPLPPPLPAADRNELAFRDVYVVRPEVTRGALYQIGRTGVASPVDLWVRSAGSEAGRRASIQVNGHELIPDRYRGYWVVGLDPADGRFLARDRFDTHRSTAESARLAAFVEAFRPGTLLVVAALDDVTWQLTDQALAALRSLGGQADPRGTFGQSHLLVGVRGAQAGQALEVVGPGPLSAAVGRVRPPRLRLEAFELR